MENIECQDFTDKRILSSGLLPTVYAIFFNFIQDH